MAKALSQILGIALSVFSFICGLLCVRDPQKVIKLQQIFYSRINWRLEPISWEKEVHNTRRMGEFLIILSLATIWILVR